METLSKRQKLTSTEHTLYVDRTDEIEHVLKSISSNMDIVRQFCQQNNQGFGNDLLSGLLSRPDKKSFLVFKHNKYSSVPTENIAFIHIKHESPVIVCFDQQEYPLNHSLDQIQHLVSEKQFFRLNRQYLINFDAIKEVEHYVARKLLVNLLVPAPDKLIVSKEKVTAFIHWLDNR